MFENLLGGTSLQGKDAGSMLAKADAVAMFFTTVRTRDPTKIRQRATTCPDILVVARMTTTARRENCIDRFVLKQYHQASGSLYSLVGSGIDF